MINVEVDGLYHRLGRKRRFQQLRDEHIYTINVKSAGARSCRTVVVRLDAEDFTRYQTERSIR